MQDSRRVLGPLPLCSGSRGSKAPTWPFTQQAPRKDGSKGMSAMQPARPLGRGCAHPDSAPCRVFTHSTPLGGRCPPPGTAGKAGMEGQWQLRAGLTAGEVMSQGAPFQPPTVDRVHRRL